MLKTLTGLETKDEAERTFNLTLPYKIWTEAGGGLPKVEVSALTIVPNARLLYAATHGRSAWKLTLP